MGVVTIALFGLFGAPDSRGDDISWVGPQNGRWDTPINWNSGVVPTPNDNVTISGDVAVTISDARELDGALTLTNRALLRIDGTMASFVANGSTSISDGRISVTEGGQAALPNVIDYTWTRCEGEALIYVDGMDSMLVMAGLETIHIDAPDCDDLLANVTVANGGFLDTPKLTSMGAAPSQFLVLTLIGDGAISVPELTRMDGTFASVGDDTELALPALTSFVNSSMLLNATAIVSAGRLAAVEQSTLSIAGTDSLAVPQLTSLVGSVVFVSAGRLVMPMLTTLEDTTISIGDDAFLSAPMVESLVATEQLVTFSTTGTGAVSLPALTSVRNVVFVASGGSTLNLPSVETYVWNLCLGAGLFTSAGENSALNFSGLRTIAIQSVNCTGLGFATSSNTGGTIDLSALTTVSSPPGQFVSFVAANMGSEIDISALSNFSNSVVLFTELDGGKIIRGTGTGSEGEGEGEGEGENTSGCPAPSKRDRVSSASSLGDLFLGAALLGALGIGRKRARNRE